MLLKAMMLAWLVPPAMLVLNATKSSAQLKVVLSRENVAGYISAPTFADDVGLVPPPMGVVMEKLETVSAIVMPFPAVPALVAVITTVAPLGVAEMPTLSPLPATLIAFAM
jgi:hypothetical protein